MTNFDDLGLAQPLLKAVLAEGYTAPTPIQEKVIPTMLTGRDILGTAQTGTGKTAAFVLPLLQRIAAHKERPAPRSCGALILAPTRELAGQIASNIRTYGRFLKLSVAVVVGGMKPGPQIRALSGGADIVVATPGRLLDHMGTGALTLAQTDVVVLDEADQMLDLGFMPAIRRILGKMPPSRQTVMLSATMPTPIRVLAQDFQTDPEEIAVAVVSRPIERIQQSVRHTPTARKSGVLTEILSTSEIGRTIVFTRTKRGADKVSRHLSDAGLKAAAIHGNKSQGQRQRTLNGFANGRTAILVATDIAARGIDIDDVSHVINFDLPQVAEAYVHRIGRTARAGRSGTAISLCDPGERGLLREIEKLIGYRLDQVSVGADGALVVAEGEALLPMENAAPPARKKKPARKGPRHANPRKKAQRGETQTVAESGRPAASKNTSNKRQSSKRPQGAERPAAGRSRKWGAEGRLAAKKRQGGDATLRRAKG
ncbi:MAG: DEAD/DEAH box helicase [Magnetospiraceae bacterium]